MANLLWLIPASPIAGYIILALFGSRLPRRLAALVGCGAAGLSAGVTIAVGVAYVSSGAPGPWVQKLWTWWDVGGLSPEFTFYLDPLSLVFCFVITFVGFLIHVYSIGYMHDDEGFSRFFSYLNLFVSSMLILVLADNLLLLYLGWEGVGLCSYLLIGFWYTDPANGRAARKAFIVTRVGDTAMAVGLFFLFWHLGTLQMQEMLGAAVHSWPVGSALATTAALLLLGGALGKSAQLPLQTWLPDAMAGPTPVSALIHAATMVTAGVYLIARMHPLFSLSPTAMLAVGVVGALTLLISGFSALVQRDIKRVLAYSTISQIGYMFLALGVGAYSAAIFHFMTHAFFKALLFLGAGAVIVALRHEQDIFKMGGLRRSLPTVFWTFVAGSASLAALPLVSSGFFSKDAILWEAFIGPAGSRWLFAAGLVGAAFTAVYTGRLLFIVFFGEERTRVGHRPGAVMLVPLVILAILATVSGFIETPETLGGITLFSDFMGGTFGGGGHDAARASAHAGAHSGHTAEILVQVAAALICFGGLGLAAWLFRKRPDIPAAMAGSNAGAALQRFLMDGCGFDWVYERVLLRPYGRIANLAKPDWIDRLYTGLALLATGLHRLVSPTQTGTMRTYAIGIVLGAVVALAIMVLR